LAQIIRPGARLELPTPFTPVLFIRDLFVPDADVICASSWHTAYSVAKLSSRKGRKYYLVQGYETWQGYQQQVNDSYHLPLHLITVSPWLTTLMRERFGHPDVTEVPNGIDLRIYTPPAKKNWARPVLLLIYSRLAIKGFADGWRATLQLLEEFPGLEVEIFGLDVFQPAHPRAHFHLSPSLTERISLYQRSTTFLWPSLEEGFGLPLLEAMATQCAVVATGAGAVPLLDDGTNLIRVQAGNPISIANGVRKLLRDPDLNALVARRGLETARQNSWKRACSRMAAALIRE